MDDTAFFAAVRTAFGPLKQAQVDGFNILLEATKALALDSRAYILATAWHETARTMQPIYERGAVSYFAKYEPGTKIGKALGNTLKGDGYRFRGRGYVQITGRANYKKASGIVGVDLVANPDQALNPTVAAVIIVNGMMDGWFTGKTLTSAIDYADARRVVNGTDKADLIAGYAEGFEAALVAASKIVPIPVPKQPDTPDVYTPEPETASTGFWAWLWSLFGKAA